MRILINLFFLFVGSTCVSQNAELRGKVTSEGKAVPFASVYFEDSSIGTTYNEDGEFSFQEIPKGKIRLVISAIGFKTFKKNISGSEKLPI